MSSLFENYYDSLGNIVKIGDTVMGVTCGYKIYGHVVDVEFDKKGNEKYHIVPDIGCTKGKENTLKKLYKISYRNTYHITVKKKGRN